MDNASSMDNATRLDNAVTSTTDTQQHAPAQVHSVPLKQAASDTSVRPRKQPIKAVFFDRDGVINQDTGYVSRASEVTFLPGIFALLHYVNSKKVAAIVVTNQSGIARGMYGTDDVTALTQWMQAQCVAHDCYMDAVYYCPHHPTAGTSAFTTACACRKPAPGMLLHAAQAHNIALEQSIMIGDSERDIVAAMAARLHQAILICDNPCAQHRHDVATRLATVRERQGVDTRIDIVTCIDEIQAILQID